MPTLREQAYHFIRQKMSSGGLSAGDRLSPAALAKEIGVSHIPVREAISQLQSEGLVDQLPRRGAFVRQPTREELVELIELRKTLECNAAAQAARRIGDVEIANLEKNLSDLKGLLKETDGTLAVGTSKSKKADRRPHDVESFLEYFARWQFIDLNFHMTILRAARNRWVVKVLEDTNVMTRMFGYRSDHPKSWSNLETFTLENYKVHREIFSAIRSHDPKAARRAMSAHMRRAKRNMLARFDWLHEQTQRSEAEVKDFPQSFRERISEAQHSRINNGRIDNGRIDNGRI